MLATVLAPTPKKNDNKFIIIGNFAILHIVLDKINIIYTRQIQNKLKLVKTKKHF